MEETPPGTDSLAESVASEIRAEMGRQGVTYAALAARLVVHPVWLHRRLAPNATRRTPLALDDLERIALHLNVDPAALVPAKAAAA